MNEYICISMTRYKEMLQAETERNILFRAHQAKAAFAIEAVANAIFSQDCKNQPADQG